MLKLGGANDAHVGAGAMSLARLQVVIGAEGLQDVALGRAPRSTSAAPATSDDAMAPGSASTTKPASAVTATRRVSVLTLPSLEIVTRGGIMDPTPSARYPRAICNL